MTRLDEERMLEGIAEYREERKPKREVPRDWEEKHDRLYRELKPKDWFGKTFDKQYRKRRDD